MKAVCITGINHLALVVADIQLAKKWFVDVLQLDLVEDRGELLFLRAGRDILAIKTPRQAINKPEHGGEPAGLLKANGGWEHLDHYGFMAPSPEAVDHFAERIAQAGATILRGPYSRSDGRSVYFRDPCGMVGEYLFYLG